VKSVPLPALAVVVGLSVAALLPAACGGGGAIEPPQIRYGEDVCVECMMIISDERSASAYLHRDDRGRIATKLFDDIGDMLIHAATHTEDDVVAWYVHDYQSREWLDATTAVYVHSDAIHTPMAMGLAAVADGAAAEALAASTEGEVLTWQDLRGQYRMEGDGATP
jgi:copper chaperone NosL